MTAQILYQGICACGSSPWGDGAIGGRCPKCKQTIKEGPPFDFDRDDDDAAPPTGEGTGECANDARCDRR